MPQMKLEVRAVGYLGAAGQGTKYTATEEGPERLKVAYRRDSGVGNQVARLFGFGSDKEFGEAFVDREAIRELHERNVVITEEELRTAGHGSYSLYLTTE